MKKLTLIIPLLSALLQAAQLPEESAPAIIPNGTNQFPPAMENIVLKGFDRSLDAL